MWWIQVICLEKIGSICFAIAKGEVFVYARFQIFEKHWLFWIVEIYCQLCKIINLLLTTNRNADMTRNPAEEGDPGEQLYINISCASVYVILVSQERISSTEGWMGWGFFKACIAERVRKNYELFFYRALKPSMSSMLRGVYKFLQ